MDARANITGPRTRVLRLDRDWQFDASHSVNLPHCVTRLSWQKWDPATWQKVWTYRRRFALPSQFRGLRVFLHFEGAMVSATPAVNGHALPQHRGGYLPFRYEITHLLKEDDNVLALDLDSRWQNVPPEGSPKGPASVDYLEPGGIWGAVALLAVPQVFLADVFAKPVHVLDSNRRIEIACSLDIADIPPGPVRVVANLMEHGRIVSSASKNVAIAKSGETEVALSLGDLNRLTLWDVAAPRLYDLAVTAFLKDQPLHDYTTRVGLREARFEVDGFFLNGRRLQLFGLNRHELYPYVGRAMPARVLRHDAEILRREFNCNMVRCSHYPQSEAFLDACDELGLMVWEEIPGWQYVGDESFQDLALRDVADMVRRDRNHPSIVIWGVRINESPNNPALYTRTKDMAKSLDDSRPTSGSMTHYSTRDWVQDVFAFDDYHAAPDGSVGLHEPLPGVPFFFSESVGQFDYPAHHGFSHKYRRAGDLEIQCQQALLHAQVHDRGAMNSHCAGVLAWCAFDYGSLMNSYAGVKCPGVADVFRIPKLGASFYLAQVDPRVRPVIEPDFYWDFGPRTPSGPGPRAAIFSNCEKLVLHLDGRRHSVLDPDRTNFPRLKYPPFFADLELSHSGTPELRIDGYIGDRRVLSRSFAADTSKDRLFLRADDAELMADGSDATRVVFRAIDRFGAPRPFADGDVTLEIAGPGIIVGDNPFSWTDSGGVGAVWIKTIPDSAGRIQLTAAHPSLGRKSVSIVAKIPPAE